MNAGIFRMGVVGALVMAGAVQAEAERPVMEGAPIVKENLSLTATWDKTFARSEKVAHEKVTFVNRYGITLAADLYRPKDGAGKLPAIAVSGPFGAVKEQASGLYAQQLAERGFLTIAFDPSFTGESGGRARFVTSPDINTEDFSAAVDFLVTHPSVDADRVGILGICGWGGLAISAAAMDTRIKATAAMTMYDMSRVNTFGYFDADDEAARYRHRSALSAQRTQDAAQGRYRLAGGVPDTLPDAAPQFVKDYWGYYKTPRGYHVRSLNSNGGRNVTGEWGFMNFPLLTYAEEIRSAVMIVHGDKAHSFYFGQTAFSRLRGTNKEFVVIPGANHVDLYDNLKVIPFDRLETFYRKAFK